MFRVALASVLGNKVRLALTGLAIVLGVAFVAGSFVLTDSISRSFDQLFADANEGVDVYVNGVSQVDGGFFADQPGEAPTFDEALVDRVADLDGVERASGVYEGTGQVIGADGEPVGGNGPPTLAGSWTGPDEPGPLTLREGEAPSGPDEVVLSADTAETAGYALGDRVTVLLADGPEDFRLVGVVGFGDADGLGGVTLALFDLATTQSLFDADGELTSIAVAGDGEDQGVLRDRIAAAVGGEGVEVVTADEQQQSQTDEIGQGLAFVNVGLLAFAGIALFVAIFLIVNTFSIIVAQRTREFGLLRAVGASSRQVRAAVTVEALVVGLVAGLVGLAAGIGLAQGMRALFGAIGFGFPDGPLVVAGRTIVVALVIGLVVTAIASLVPARRAARTSPMEALRSDAGSSDEAVGRGRTDVGVLGLVGGVGLLLLGLSDAIAQPAAAAGAGAAAAFVGVSLLAPYLAGPVAALVGGVPARLGVPGRLARNNASSNRKRTASTASALMIGVALVSFVSIFASSAIASVNQLFTESLGADYILTSTDQAGAGLQPGVASRLGELDELGAVSPFRSVNAEVADAFEPLIAVRGAEVDDLVALDVQEGSLDALEGGVFVHVDRMAADGLAVGDELDVTFTSGPASLPVRGTFANQDLVGADLLVDVATLDQLGVGGVDFFVFADVADGVEPEVARAAVQQVVDDFPRASLQDQTEYTQTLRGQVDGLLNVMIGLLGLALVIALIGIVNTLALSVFERTREIGLLRAVGMTRRQVRAMVRWEAVVVSVFGGLLGVAVGTVFGWAMVQASSGSGIEVLEVPVLRLVTYVVVAGIAGVLAAVLPARRAARLDVLAAVTGE